MVSRRTKYALTQGGERTVSETVPPIVGRFLFADIAAWHDVNELPVDHEISVDELDDCLSAGKISVQNGDIVLIRTGKARGFYNPPSRTAGAHQVFGTMLASSLTAAAPQCWPDTPGTERLPFYNPDRTLDRDMLADAIPCL